MRGEDVTQGALFSYVSLDERVPKDHPLRRMRLLVDGILASLSDEFAALYSHTGRPSVAPEKRLRALLLQVLYTIRSERQLVKQLDYNLLFRWFVGLGIDDPVWDRTVFCANRDRLLSETLAREFFDRVLAIAEWRDLVSDEHFSVDGTLIEAWASHKSFVRKDGSGPDRPAGRNPEVDFSGEKRSNATHPSTTDPEARLYKKGEFTEAKLRYLTHALAENRHGLIVDVETTQATGTAEVEAAERMVERTVPEGATVGTDKAYDQEKFVAGLLARGIQPHVARKNTGSAVDGRTARGKGYAMSRSGLDRCLRRHGVASLKALLPPAEKTKIKPFKAYEPGFLHVDVKYLPAIDGEPRRYLFVAIDRATRWVYVALKPNRTALSAKAFLKAAIQATPFRIQTCLADNGSAFTDRFLTRAKQPSGEHDFDRLCAEQAIEHRLIPPRRPQTNGRVERFNGRIEEVLQTHRFDATVDLETTLHRYVVLYNHHIPQRALGHLTPVQALRNWQTSHPHLFRKKVYKQAGLDT